MGEAWALVGVALFCKLMDKEYQSLPNFSSSSATADDDMGALLCKTKPKYDSDTEDDPEKGMKLRESEYKPNTDVSHDRESSTNDNDNNSQSPLIPTSQKDQDISFCPIPIPRSKKSPTRLSDTEDHPPSQYTLTNYGSTDPSDNQYHPSTTETNLNKSEITSDCNITEVPPQTAQLDTEQIFAPSTTESSYQGGTTTLSTMGHGDDGNFVPDVVVPIVPSVNSSLGHPTYEEYPPQSPSEYSYELTTGHYPCSFSQLPSSGAYYSYAKLENARYSVDQPPRSDHDNDDRAFVINREGRATILAVFDGHDGNKASSFVDDYMYRLFNSDDTLNRLVQFDIHTVLTNVFLYTEEAFFNKLQPFITEKELIQRTIPKVKSSYSCSFDVVRF